MSNRLKLARMIANNNNTLRDRLIATAGTDSSHKWISIDQAEQLIDLVVAECCVALNPVLRDMISRGQGVHLIKQHFGMNPNEITTAMLDTAIEQCEQELAVHKQIGTV